MIIFKFFYKLLKTIILLMVFFILFAISFGIYYGYKNVNKYYTITKSTTEKTEYIAVEDLSITDDTNILGNTMNYFEFKNKLESIYNDNEVKGIIVNLDTFKMNNREFDEIRELLDKIHKNKELYFYSENMTKGKYYKAISGTILMPKSSSANFSLGGYQYNEMYIKGLLDKIGIEYYSIKSGENKSVYENLTRDNISENEKKQETKLISYYEKLFINQLKTRRTNELSTYIEDIVKGNNVYSDAILASEKGYIDNFIYYDELDEMQNIVDYKAKSSRKNTKKPTIAILTLEGEIGSDEQISIYNIKEQIDELYDINNLVGIIIRINSPGGSSFEAERIYNLMKELKEFKVPIYTQGTDILASGGYYISLAGDKIFASNGTLVGSIGVISLITKIDKLNKKLNINTVNIKQNPIETSNNPNLPLDEKDMEKLQKQVNRIYDDFKEIVLKERKIDKKELDNLAQGQVFTTDEAQKYNLIDGIKNIDEVIELMAKDNNLDEYEIKVIKTENNNYRTIFLNEINKFFNTRYNKIENKYLYK